MTADTNTTSYWVNWRVLLCSVWLLIPLLFASILLPKYEGYNKSEDEGRESEQDPQGVLYKDDVWRPCLRSIHPGVLLGFRLVAFLVLLSILILDVFIEGYSMIFYYTQWTLMLLALYFGLGTVLSIYGCSQYQNKVGGERTENEEFDSECGAHRPSMHPEIPDVYNTTISLSPDEEWPRQIAGLWGYIFQIIFQMIAGAVTLTDCVFWFVLMPMLIEDDGLDLLTASLHSVNGVVLLGETALNSLRFPWFRIAYFFLWTTVYMSFQWVIHASIALWWPYPFLDLSSSLCYLWYLSVALAHIPCFGLFFVIIRMKQYLLSKWFTQTYRCPR